MKKFLLYCLIFFVLFCGIFFIIFCRADGYTDASYLRLTTKAQESMVIGTSRAAQALQPEILNHLLGRKDIFNYSFSNAQSSFGPVYLESIKRKLDPNSKHGIFIICVDPLSVCSDKRAPNDTKLFSEASNSLGKTSLVNVNPNVEYLVRTYDEPFYTILTKNKKNTRTLIHSDGWLEVNVPFDTAVFNQKATERIQNYQDKVLPGFAFSATRFLYLEKTISFLKNHGKVYLVRLPVHPGFKILENSFMPDFDSRIDTLSKRLGVSYFNLINSPKEYFYTDGNHLYKASGKDVSTDVGKWISTQGKR